MGQSIIKTEVRWTCDRCHASDVGSEKMPEGWANALAVSQRFSSHIGQINVSIPGSRAMAQFQLGGYINYMDGRDPVLLCSSCYDSFVEWMLAPFRAKYGDSVEPRGRRSVG